MKKILYSMSHQAPAKALAGTSRPRTGHTFRALSHRNYRLWFFGQGLSLIGTWMQSMAQQVLVYRLTGSAVALGIARGITIDAQRSTHEHLAADSRRQLPQG